MLTMTKGLPASGKSTWAKDLVLRSNGGWKRVNKDDLRAMIDAGKHSNEREKEILAIRDDIIAYHLSHGHSVVVDDTNLSPTHEGTLRTLAKLHSVPFDIKDFTDVPFGECIKRNRMRTDKEPVPEKVIFDMWKRYIYSPPKHDPMLPNAVVCDLDGTLAILGNRSPYDTTTVYDDTVNSVVQQILVSFLDRGYDIIFVSGRKGNCYADTLRWIESKAGFFNPLLIMRGVNDNSSDELVKREIYKNHIEGKFNVMAWIDDRPRVIRMARFELCLPVIDVGYGVEF